MICLIPLVGDPKIGSPPVRVCLGFLGCTWFDRSYLMIALLGTNISYISQGGIMLVPWRIYKKPGVLLILETQIWGKKKRGKRKPPGTMASRHLTSTLPKFKQFASKSELTLWKQLSCLDISGFFWGGEKRAHQSWCQNLHLFHGELQEAQVFLGWKLKFPGPNVPPTSTMCSPSDVSLLPPFWPTCRYAKVIDQVAGFVVVKKQLKRITCSLQLVSP